MGDSGTTENAGRPGNGPGRAVAAWTFHVLDVDTPTIALFKHDDPEPVAVLHITGDHNEDTPAANLEQLRAGWGLIVARYLTEHWGAMRAAVRAADELSTTDEPLNRADDAADAYLRDQGAPNLAGGQPLTALDLYDEYAAWRTITDADRGISAGDLFAAMWDRLGDDPPDESTLRRHVNRWTEGHKDYDAALAVELADLYAAKHWEPPTDNERHARDRQHMARLDPKVAAIMEAVARALAGQSPPKSPPSEPGNE